jgi:large subunit ribosomal protein L21
MYAIFENGSHQFRVREGDRITIDRRDGEAGAEVVFDQVLLVANDDGATIGTPLVTGARVVGKVERQFRDKKIIIQKFRRRKNMRRRRGHRQSYTTVQITSVFAGGPSA